MGSLAFTSWQFALAGALCAAGPLLIHLLNRRRYRTIQWAAMDFLREALARQRRILHLRDLVLLALRTLAVLLFGLALARPFLAAQREQFDERQPLHAVLVIDNSLSMAYESLEGTLLDRAKARAREFLDRLPRGSRISILPACGSRQPISVEPLESPAAALEALDAITVVDRQFSLAQAVQAARQACELAPQLAKRVIWIGDQQALNWRDAEAERLAADLPGLQVVEVAAGERENTWVADIRLEDGLADVETPATVVVALAHRGASARRDLVVTLRLGDQVVGEQTVTLEPGLGQREVDFECSFSGLPNLPEPGRPLHVALTASITPDRLPADDERSLVVPVVAALPVVFVDQYGPALEDPVRGRLGETRHLRKLLAPRTSRSDALRQLVAVRHLAADEVTQAALADARVVVVAGLRSPGLLVDLLREYVEQGGQLLVAAGAEFDPAEWAGAWRDGGGILPLPLAPEPIGATPEAAGGAVQPFFPAFESLAQEPYFRLAGVPEAELRELYAEPFFFKAVKADDSSSALAAWRSAETRRMAQRREAEAALRGEQAALAERLAAGTLAASERDRLAQIEQELRALAPGWLVWAAGSELQLAGEPGAASDARPLAIPTTHEPRVIARYDLPGRPPFLVARAIGRGRVVFCTSGLLSSWNTLPKSNAVVVFDRLLRDFLHRTLPERNFPASDRLTLPLPPEHPRLSVTLQRPGRDEPSEALDAGYIGADRQGVALSHLLVRGVYRVVGTPPADAAAPGGDKPVWDVPLAIAGPADESDLTPLGRERMEALASGAIGWVGPEETIRLAGAATRGQNSWWWLALTVLVLLVAEMAVLVWTLPKPRPAVVVGRGFSG